MNKFGDGMTALSGILGMIPGAQPFALGAGALGFLGNMAQKPQGAGYTQPNYQFGGVMGDVERDEVVQTPDGQMAQIGGGTHAEGNDTTIMAPEGTAVYSDSIEIDGKTMAERKLARERRMKKLEGEASKISEDMEDNPIDAISRESNERQLELVMAEYIKEIMEEEADMQVQEIVASANEPQQPMSPDMGGQEMAPPMGQEMGEPPMMKYGGKIKKYRDGGVMSNLNPRPSIRLTGAEGQPVNDMINVLGSPRTNVMPNAQVEGFNPNQFADWGGVRDFLNPVNTLPPAQSDTTLPTGAGEIPQSRIQQSYDKFGDPTAVGAVDGAGGLDTSLNPWSKAGSMMNIFGPTAITALQRLGDRPNPNYFENYGTEGLRTQGQAFGAAAGSRDRSLADVDRAVAAQRFRTQSGARGVNTQRALDMTTLQQGGHQKQQIRDNYRQHVANLFRERAGLQDRRDQVVMGGAAQADVANRQDRASFHTNLARSLTQGAKSAQHYGKMQDLAKAMAEGRLQEQLMFIYGLELGQ